MKLSSRTPAPETTSTQPYATQPLVSIIMPAYNAAAYIGEAIESVLAQDHPNKELIVIDDGSEDGTLARLSTYGDRLTLITQQNQGSAAARNAGLDAARGQYIAFLDSDDVWLPGKLKLQVAYLQRNPEIEMVFSRWGIWKPDHGGKFPPPTQVATALNGDPDALPSIVPERSGWLYNRLLFSSLLHTITVVVRRSLVESVGRFDTDLKRGQDYDYWIRASRHTPIHQIDRVLALYRVHGQGCIRRWPTINYERVVVEKALKRWGLEGPNGEQTPPSKIRSRLAETSFSFGYHHYWEGDPKLALRAFAHAVANRPGKPRAWAYLALAALKGSFPWRAAVKQSTQGQ